MRRADGLPLQWWLIFTITKIALYCVLLTIMMISWLTMWFSSCWFCLQHSENSLQHIMTIIKRDLEDSDFLHSNPHDLTCDLDGNSIQGLSRIHESDPSSQLVCNESKTKTSSRISSVFPIKFDHNRCSDCAIGFTIANDCVAALWRLHEQAIAINDRLSILVELRERITEIALSLDISNQSNHSNQSFQSTDSFLSASHSDSSNLSEESIQSNPNDVLDRYSDPGAITDHDLMSHGTIVEDQEKSMPNQSDSSDRPQFHPREKSLRDDHESHVTMNLIRS